MIEIKTILIRTGASHLSRHTERDETPPKEAEQGQSTQVLAQDTTRAPSGDICYDPPAGQMATKPQHPGEPSGITSK